ADRVFQRLLSVISPGMTEREVAAEISYFLRKEGADGDAFEPIVVSGPNSALVHGTPSNRKLRPGDAVLLDFGARYRGYHSDISRTVFIGKIKPRLQAVYDAVLEAQETAIAAVAPGVRARSVYDLAHEVLKRYGFAKYFNHGLGHGLGLEVHEFPRLSHDSTDTLDQGMVFTVEPGVYIPRLGGVRIEDDILVTARGNTVLTKSPKAPIVL
ncbi:MAG: aminopeptidase P family protein, partial [Chlorobi bacterium]|nr:aminopeptidase P family protein [Chlorobiota bacterium]